MSPQHGAAAEMTQSRLCGPLNAGFPIVHLKVCTALNNKCALSGLLSVAIGKELLLHSQGRGTTLRVKLPL
jgi:hypothetical protein